MKQFSKLCPPYLSSSARTGSPGHTCRTISRNISGLRGNPTFSCHDECAPKLVPSWYPKYVPACPTIPRFSPTSLPKRLLALARFFSKISGGTLWLITLKKPQVAAARANWLEVLLLRSPCVVAKLRCRSITGKLPQSSSMNSSYGVSNLSSLGSTKSLSVRSVPTTNGCEVAASSGSVLVRSFSSHFLSDGPRASVMRSLRCADMVAGFVDETLDKLPVKFAPRVVTYRILLWLRCRWVAPCRRYKESACIFGHKVGGMGKYLSGLVLWWNW